MIEPDHFDALLLDLLTEDAPHHVPDRLVPETLRGGGDLLTRLQTTGAALTFADPAIFGGRRAAGELCAHFGVATLDAFGVGDLAAGVQAGAAALAYLRATQGERLGHLTRSLADALGGCRGLDRLRHRGARGLAGCGRFGRTDDLRGR